MSALSDTTEGPVPPELPVGAGASQFPGVSLNVTYSSNITLHMIEDAELDKLTSVGRPFFLGIAMAALGGALGLIVSLFEALDRFGQSKTRPVDATVLLIFGACVMAFIAFGIVAGQSVTDARKLKTKIRARPFRPI